jgi:hypothetical protein
LHLATKIPSSCNHWSKQILDLPWHGFSNRYPAPLTKSRERVRDPGSVYLAQRESLSAYIEEREKPQAEHGRIGTVHSSCFVTRYLTYDHQLEVSLDARHLRASSKKIKKNRASPKSGLHINMCVSTQQNNKQKME